MLKRDMPPAVASAWPLDMLGGAALRSKTGFNRQGLMRCPCGLQPHPPGPRDMLGAAALRSKTAAAPMRNAALGVLPICTLPP